MSRAHPIPDPLDLSKRPVSTPPCHQAENSRGSDSNSSAVHSERRKSAPIPDEMKDARYFERRAKNNISAKKSRDAARERAIRDRLRVEELEKTILVLKTQNRALRQLLGVPEFMCEDDILKFISQLTIRQQ